MAHAARSEEAQLKTYRKKRHFDATPEPSGSARIGRQGARSHRFVVQKHAASRLHYDFRLEAGGVLKSWAIPKGPSLDPKEHRLAAEVEDHPLDYFDFEGVIPAGNYGAGEVIVWDWGTYEVVGGGDPADSIARGHLKIRLHGKELGGDFTLVKIRPRGGASKGNTWLLTKLDDAEADPSWTIDAHGESAKSGRSLESLQGDDRAETWPSKKRTANAKAKAMKPEAAKPKAKGAKSAANGKPDPIPTSIHPELATLIDAPFDDDDWLFEIKWDGFRAIASIDADGEVTLTSRNGKDFASRFPSLTSIGQAFTTVPALVDGEIVAFDAQGKSRFQLLQNAASAKITYVVFDALYAEGKDLRKEPLEARKEALSRIVRPKQKDVVLSTHVVGKGRDLFAAASAEGLEGIVAKRRNAPYIEARTRDWVKIKAQLEQECVIAGFTEPGGARSGFGALILGLYERGELVYCGNVGTGFDAGTLARLSKQLKDIETARSPFAHAPKTRGKAHWVKPKLVAQVRFTEWTHDGSMRHPAFLGLRDDKAPHDCKREKPRDVSEVA
jgi:bifunctional non-homologous end joining protein LigD